MGRLHLEQIDSIAGFRAVAAAWDDLWQRSEVTLPTVRAELVAQWLEFFAPAAKVRGLLVWEEGRGPGGAWRVAGDGTRGLGIRDWGLERANRTGLSESQHPIPNPESPVPSPTTHHPRPTTRLVAALPLVGRRAKGVLPVGDLTSNCWSANGELLLDPAADADAVLEVMADALQETLWPLVWLDLVPPETSRWQGLSRALTRRGLSVASHVRYRIGQVELSDDFAAYEAGLSKNLRRNLHKDLRRLERAGPVQWNLISQFTPDEVNARLREVFEIEARSWKVGPGRAVLETPGMFDFYRRQAEQLAAWGHLRVTLLEQCGRPIACELGWVAKGVYHSFKVAYDRAFREYGPGHLLRMLLTEEFFRRSDAKVIDFQGPMTKALASWSTKSYPIGRLVIAPKRLGSRLLLAGYRAAASVTRRLRRAAAW